MRLLFVWRSCLPVILAAMCGAAAVGQQARLDESQAELERVKVQLEQVDSRNMDGPFQAGWESLGNYKTPDWFRDAKFGIFIHWGVFSVPAYGNEWYPRNMYLKNDSAYQHHIDTYGPQARFGYKDFIPMFRAEHFDPDAWVDLFAKAGARYVVPVAEHCDGFAMYDSGISDWNAAKMGPKRDVVEAIETATRKHGLHFGVSSHRAEHFWWYDGGLTFDSDVRDVKYAGIYGPARPRNLNGVDGSQEPDPNHLETWLAPDKDFMDDWLARSSELVDKYHPDLLYFDWWIGQPAFQPYLKRVAAYYYNEAAKKKQSVVLTYKGEAFPANTATLDVERAKLDAIRLLPWQTDTSVSIKSWGYIKDDSYRDAKSLIDELVDVVSKNGNLLLNVGPRADGTVPEEVQSVLRQMGDWLRVNGEAIYGSRPWALYGEGPTKVTKSGLNTDQQEFTSEDVRYTTNHGALYAIALGWPATGMLQLRTLWTGNPYSSGPVCDVRLLGSSSKLSWKQREDGLRIELPANKPDEPAFVFEIWTNPPGSVACGKD
jgi:alpha-L-fucosidase